MRIELPLPFTRSKLTLCLDGTVQNRKATEVIIRTPIRPVATLTADDAFVDLMVAGQIPYLKDGRYIRLCLACNDETPLYQSDFLCAACRIKGEPYQLSRAQLAKSARRLAGDQVGPLELDDWGKPQPK